VSVFDMGEWEEQDVGILPDGAPLSDYIVTDRAMATHRRFRNRQTGEVITDRM
jgi:hypothetical protein